MKIMILTVLLFLTYFSQTDHSPWANTKNKRVNERNEFFSLAGKTEYMITGNILSIDTGPYFDHINPLDLVCKIVADKVVKNCMNLPNTRSIERGDTISIYFSTDHYQSTPEDKIKLGKYLIFFTKQSVYSSDPRSEDLYERGVFEFNESLCTECRNSNWNMDSSKYYNDSIQEIRLMRKRIEYLKKIIFLTEVFDEKNNLLYIEKKSAFKNDLFGSRTFSGDELYYVPNKITETWYDKNGNITKTIERTDYLQSSEPVNSPLYKNKPKIFN